MDQLIAWHRRRYPLMQPQDVVKLVFQARMGCGHLLADETAVNQRIADEEASLFPSADEPLTEPLGPDYLRLNLRRAMAEGIPSLWIARLMAASLPAVLPERQSVVEELTSLGDEAITIAAKRLTDDPAWLPSHTPAYHQAYAPAYRVISKQCGAMLPILQKLAHTNKKQTLLCMDGPCGSGKTTLAALLQKITEAALVPMDDFFLPHPMKTPQRLSQPGGNADWERLVEEFLTPWLRDGQACYRPYHCHTGQYGKPVTVPARPITILEGSYSLMPQIARHADVKVFLQVDPDTQRQRILRRNGEAMLKVFQERWIPLEQAYFSAFALPDGSCLTLPQSEQFV